MVGASIETTLALWASSLRDVKGHCSARTGLRHRQVCFWMGC